MVPALLTDDKNKLQQMLDLCSGFAGCVQIDIMDGEFVPSTSVSLDDMMSVNYSGKVEAHLMVNNPLSWIEPFRKLGAYRIIYHFEIGVDHDFIIDSIKRHGFEAGIAVNPGTANGDFQHLVHKVDSVLFMSVNPGFYGAPFIPEVLPKIREFKNKYPLKTAGIDGGVKLDNAAKIVRESLVDYVCVGSAILRAADPAAAYREFTGRING